VGDGDSGGGYARVKTGGIREISVLSAQFFCESKAALINKVS
jgi:hypothetical protein